MQPVHCLMCCPNSANKCSAPLLEQVYRTRLPYVGKEASARLARGEGTTEAASTSTSSTRPFRNVEGEIEGIFVIASDVTEQVLARNQARHLREAAEAANRAKDEFLAMLGHELRNPLAPILTALAVDEAARPRRRRARAQRHRAPGRVT